MLSQKLSKRLPRWCRNVQKNYSFGLFNYNEQQQPYIDDVIQEKMELLLLLLLLLLLFSLIFLLKI